MKSNRAGSDKAGRRTPGQSRSIATVTYILDAAENIIEEKGLDGLNTNAVAQTAGVSVGSIYQYFSDKQAIVSALIYRMHERILSSLEDMHQSMSQMEADDALKRIITDSIAVHGARPRLTEILEQQEDRLPRSAELDAIEQSICVAMGNLMAKQVDATQLQPGSLDLIAADVLNIIRVMTVPSPDRPDERLDERIYWALKGYLEKCSD